ncbi:DNA adenine methylase/adenine-specific DNA-methyltransferase [Clostridium sp. USBA 49]|uniref:DNA adenine methylase n=1 Tax=Clostridium sp. USBA 49 TaxID=1881060 RepID=UPI00099B08A5|nr:DNA adenine methylase [Clostridium sp. USBA 49]SKA92853.1 DNA adenine methylase/adenine-specific DNA-methyltransferase [Clostridium sp. USBA 49]
MQSKLIKSPLNYTGGKFRLLSQILPLFPNDINIMIDLFCGGCNVGINVNANKIIAIDKSNVIINLMKIFKELNSELIITKIKDTIYEFNLSDTSRHGYDYYNTNSSDGLAKVNKNNFLNLRNYLNKMTDKEGVEYYILLYTLIVYSFNNQIRFNAKGDFNIPVGKRDFNENIKNNLLSFIERLHNFNIEFICMDFNNYDYSRLGKNDFVYADPPYLITCATYNEQNSWTEDNEIKLLTLLDSLNNRGIRFALSNVLENKGRSNDILKEWSKKYNVHYLNHSYNNSNYQIKDRTNKSIEVLITNY